MSWRDTLTGLLDTFSVEQENEKERIADYSRIPLEDRRQLLNEQLDTINTQRNIASKLIQSSFLLVSVIIASLSLSGEVSPIQSTDETTTIFLELLLIVFIYLVLYVVIFSIQTMYESLDIIQNSNSNQVHVIGSDRGYNRNWHSDIIQKRKSIIESNEDSFHRLAIYGKTLIFTFTFAVILLLVYHVLAQEISILSDFQYAFIGIVTVIVFIPVVMTLLPMYRD